MFTTLQHLKSNPEDYARYIEAGGNVQVARGVYIFGAARARLTYGAGRRGSAHKPTIQYYAYKDLPQRVMIVENDWPYWYESENPQDVINTLIQYLEQTPIGAVQYIGHDNAGRSSRAVAVFAQRVYDLENEINAKRSTPNSNFIGDVYLLDRLTFGETRDAFRTFFAEAHFTNGDTIAIRYDKAQGVYRLYWDNEPINDPPVYWELREQQEHAETLFDQFFSILEIE